MPALTRRRYRDLPRECWRLYFGDVHAGTISQCVGNPGAAPKWQWRCGFYPGSRPSECTGGTAETFDEARGLRARMGRVPIEAKLTFGRGANTKAWTAEKYRRFDQGERMPLDWQSVQQTNLIQ